MKNLFILIYFLLINSYLFAEWQNVGNCERINAYTSNISKFVIDDSSNYLFTLDTGNIIKKWNYQTGEQIWTKHIKEDIKDEYVKNYTFLSSDGKTYLTSAVNYSINNSPTQYVFIHDIETDVIIDSLVNPNLPIYYQGYCAKFPTGYYADYISNTKKLISYVNTEEQCIAGPYSLSDYSGTLIVYKKSDSGFVGIANLGDYNFSASGVNLNRHLDKIIFQGSTTNSYFKNNYMTSNGNTFTNGILSLNSLKMTKITDYKYKSEALYPNPAKVTESGTKLPFSSMTFTETDSIMYFLSDISLFKFDLFADTLTKIYDLINYTNTDNFRICYGDEWIYYIIKGDSIKIHLFYKPNFIGGLKVDSIKLIALTQNSKDKKYLFLTDSTGNLYRIYYYKIMDVVSVKEPQQFESNDLTISPNPASDYIEITKPSKGFKPSEGYAVRIFDILGMKITTPSLRDTPPYQDGEIVRIDISGLAPGVYFVRIGNVVRKFVKM